jgi:hypothetical protein
LNLGDYGLEFSVPILGDLIKVVESDIHFVPRPFPDLGFEDGFTSGVSEELRINYDIDVE